MAMTLCQKQLMPFCQIVQHFVLFGSSNNVQILIACGTNSISLLSLSNLQIIFQTSDQHIKQW